MMFSEQPLMYVPWNDTLLSHDVCNDMEHNSILNFAEGH